MKQATQSSFNEGLLMDMNPLVSPQTCLSDCLNGTIITFNGNEFTLQNDSGNVSIEDSKLPNGFIPVGMKEYGGIIYTALLNPVTNKCQIGSIPSPDYSNTPKDQSRDGINISFNGNNFKNNITKLFEFDQLVLNPGDEYKIIYSINPVNGKDISAVYNVKWIAIDESGKEYDLKDPNIIKESDLNEFKPFNQTIRAILGLEITLNNIDWFEVAGQYAKNEDVFDITLNLYGKNKIKPSGSSDDDLYIRGCKIECLSHEYGPEYIWDKNIYDKEVNNEEIPESLLSDGFRQNVKINKTFPSDTEVTFTVTPFDQYKMLDELKRTIFLKTGEVYESGNINDLFQYKYSSSNKSLRLDFNANLKGFTNPRVYLEFYDIWSDYSVIIPVNDPNPYGKNTLFISTSSEKCTNVFNSLSRGGIDTNQLEIFQNNSDYKPTIGGKINQVSNEKEYYIRKNQILRERNLYIVKISIIENIDNVLNYHDVFKVFTLNELMNDKYTEYQLNENPNLRDFTTLSQKASNLNVKYSINEVIDEQAIITSSDSELTIKTNVDSQEYYYKLTSSDLNINTETCHKTITKRRIYDLNLEINDDSIGYGIISGFNLTKTPEIKQLNTNIIETDELIKSTQSEVNILSTSSNSISLENILQTNRNITAEIKKENRTVRSNLKTTSVWDTMVSGNNDEPSGFIRVIGNYHHPRQITLGDTKNVIAQSSAVNNSTINSYFSDSRVSNNRRISGGILYWANTYSGYVDINGVSHGKWCVSKIKSSGTEVPRHINNYLICLKNKNGNFNPVFTSSSGAAVNVLKNIYSSVVKTTDYRLYYYSNIVSNKESTSYTKPEFTISDASEITFSQYSHFYDNNYNQSNILQIINTLINDSLSTSNINYVSLDSNNYLQVVNTSSPINFSIQLDKLEITDGVDKSMLNKLTTSKSDLEFNEASKLINSSLPDKTPYSLNHSGVANKFTVTYETINNEAVNPVFIYNHSNLQLTDWAVEGKGDRNDEDGYYIDTSIFEL